MCAAVGAAAQDISAGVEARRDRLEYHFDNPSSFDTPALVPHFFEQRYDADNVWLTVTARYGRTRRFQTAFGIARPRGTIADDYDTFFDPGGTVWVSGTTGPADVKSISCEQWVSIARSRSDARRYNVEIGYRLRVDAFDFGVGHKTVTRDGRLVEVTDVTSRESTTSQLHQFLAAFDAGRDLPAGWRIAARGEVAPLALGRLSVRLPDKYPGQDLTFVANGFGTSGRIEAVRTIGAWRVGIAAGVGRTWSYGSSDAVRLTTLAATIAVARQMVRP